MTTWRRIDRDTIQAEVAGTKYQIRVTGENASAKPNQWGLYKAVQASGGFNVDVGELVWVEVRGKPSRFAPQGRHLEFDKQSAAKRFVLMRTP